MGLARTLFLLWLVSIVSFSAGLVINRTVADTMGVSPLVAPQEVWSWAGASNASGVATISSMDCAKRYWVEPTTAGEFANQITCAAGTVTVSWRKFKPAGLGITLATLLSVSIFEDSSGVVNFNLFGTNVT